MYAAKRAARTLPDFATAGRAGGDRRSRDCVPSQNPYALALEDHRSRRAPVGEPPAGSTLKAMPHAPCILAVTACGSFTTCTWSRLTAQGDGRRLASGSSHNSQEVGRHGGMVLRSSPGYGGRAWPSSAARRRPWPAFHRCRTSRQPLYRRLGPRHHADCSAEGDTKATLGRRRSPESEALHQPAPRCARRTRRLSRARRDRAGIFSPRAPGASAAPPIGARCLRAGS